MKVKRSISSMWFGFVQSMSHLWLRTLVIALSAVSFSNAWAIPNRLVEKSGHLLQARTLQELETLIKSQNQTRLDEELTLKVCESEFKLGRVPSHCYSLKEFQVRALGRKHPELLSDEILEVLDETAGFPMDLWYDHLDRECWRRSKEVRSIRGLPKFRKLIGPEVKSGSQHLQPSPVDTCRALVEKRRLDLQYRQR